MNCFTKYLTALTLGLVTASSFANPPRYLSTDNQTSVESNAFVAGTFPSPTPSKAKAVNDVPWIVVQMACYGRSTGKMCPATIKMATNTSTPEVLASVEMNVDTGVINILSIDTSSKYNLIVNGPGKVTLIEK